jgi:multiple sugar transport system permease protein
MSWIQSFQVFDAIYVLTAGGPLNATTVMAMQIYENGFQYLHMGYASAQAYILFLMVMIGIYLYLRRMKTEVVY